MFSSEFAPKRNNTIIGVIALLILAAGTLALINSEKEEEPTVDLEAQEAARFAEINKRRQLEKELKAKEEAEIKRAALAAIEKQKAAELAAKKEQQRLEKVAAEEKLKADRITLREKVAREAALSAFVGTTYKTFEVEGKTYNKVKVTKATPASISIIHSTGARSFQYTQLSEDIKKRCHFDPVASQTYLDEMDSKRSAKRSASSQRKSASKATDRTVTNRISNRVSQKRQQKKQAVHPRGSITATVTGQKSGHDPYLYRRNKRYDYHYKTVSVKAKANVDATLYNNNSPVGSISAGETRTFTVRSTHKGKYSLELRSKSGKVLDREAHNRKSGLSPSSL